MSDIHSCSYYCTRPACVLAQRDELRDSITALQARVAELEADREQFERTIDQQEGMYSQCCDERMALRADLAAARADAARLEWLAQHPLEGTIRIGGDLKPCTFWGVSSAGTDLRAAIDAAMKEKP